MNIKKSGKNIWTQDGTEFVKSEKCPGEGWYPSVSMRRVHGSTYTPYVNDGEWAERANKALANHARGNFEKR